MHHLDTIMQICLKFNRNDYSALVQENPLICEIIKKLAPNQSAVIPAASRIGFPALFQPIFTREGLCYTYNSMNSREIYTNEWVELRWLLDWECLSKNRQFIFPLPELHRNYWPFVTIRLLPIGILKMVIKWMVVIVSHIRTECFVAVYMIRCGLWPAKWRMICMTIASNLRPDSVWPCTCPMRYPKFIMNSYTFRLSKIFSFP